MVILLIVLRAQAMVVENTMYPLLPASDDDNNASFGIDLSNVSKDAARNSNLNADTDGDEESVVAEENKNQMQEEEEQVNSLINHKKSMIHSKSKSKSKSKRSKGTPPVSISKIGTYYRVINVYFDEIHCSNVAKLGSAPSISKLDSRQFLHKHVYDCLLETYSDVNIIKVLIVKCKPIIVVVVVDIRVHFQETIINMLMKKLSRVKLGN